MLGARATRGCVLLHCRSSLPRVVGSWLAAAACGDAACAIRLQHGGWDIGKTCDSARLPACCQAAMHVATHNSHLEQYTQVVWQGSANRGAALLPFNGVEPPSLQMAIAQPL